MPEIEPIDRGRDERMSSALQSAIDAERRSKPMLLRYRITWGSSFRRRLGKLRYMLAIPALVAFVILFGGLSDRLAPHDTMLLAGYFVFGSLATLLAALAIPKDELYMDRLAIIVPERNLLSVPLKLLWSRVDEVQIVDLSKNERASRFALRLIEPDGAWRDIRLESLDRDSLPSLVSYIKTYAPHARGLAQLQELERFFDYQNKHLEGVSYTQLWESGTTAQFGLTSFTPLLPGAELQERFRVVRQIAAGGFSAVYLIADEEEKLYVLKESVVPGNLDEDLRKKAAEQFEREARLLARVQHEQIATVYDHFVENNRNYLQMEYIEGENMRKHIAGNKAPLEGTVQMWIEQLAGILAYLHGLAPPVVHRDLTPDNVVVRPDGRLVLIDFGAANEFVGQATGTLVGKHAYMAPEQIRGNAEPRSDIYSLGCCAYYCLTGRDPEPIRSSSPKTVSANVSDWFDRFVVRATALDADERFQSALECLEYLRKPDVAPASASQGRA